MSRTLACYAGIALAFLAIQWWVVSAWQTQGATQITVVPDLLYSFSNVFGRLVASHLVPWVLFDKKTFPSRRNTLQFLTVVVAVLSLAAYFPIYPSNQKFAAAAMIAATLWWGLFLWTLIQGLWAEIDAWKLAWPAMFLFGATAEPESVAAQLNVHTRAAQAEPALLGPQAKPATPQMTPEDAAAQPKPTGAERTDPPKQRFVQSSDPQDLCLEDDGGRALLSVLDGSKEKHLEVAARSVIQRASSARRASVLCLACMVGLVFLGGGASVGLWLTDRRASLADLSNEYQGLDGIINNITKSTPNKQLEDWRQDLQMRQKALDAYLGTAGTTTQPARGTDASTASAVSGIATRVTVAVLTLLLIQVFYSLFKYLRRNYDTLMDKAEAISVVARNPAMVDQLCQGLVRLAERGTCDFPAEAKMVTEQIGDLVGTALSNQKK